VVDPFCIGAVPGADLSAPGYAVLAVYPSTLEQLVTLSSLEPAGLRISFCAVPAAEGALEAPKSKLLVLVGVEAMRASVMAGEEQVHPKGAALSESSRSSDVVVGTWLRAEMHTALGKIAAWQESEWKHPAVLYQGIAKPMDSFAGSDCVTMRTCEVEVAEIGAAAEHITGKTVEVGFLHKAVLVQECLVERESVVDLAPSKDGCCILPVLPSKETLNATFDRYYLRALPYTAIYIVDVHDRLII
jgi:hypothetical protein